MFDCANDIWAYHDDKVTLAQKQQTEMRERRDANRKRLKKGLKDKEKPTPKEFVSQGSYAMKTMTQHPENDYDIDDGVYFEKSDLVGPRGAEMSALDARQMVRDALDDGSFKTAPEARKNCVRVYYEGGYHVDVPVYRRVVTTNSQGKEVAHYELASSDWKRSDARDVTDWFDTENQKQSPDTENGRQLRRITRLLKKFAKSRSSWGSSILSGFGITKLVTENYKANLKREDTALYDTMKAIRDRLNLDLVVKHPVTPNETITKGKDDPKARFFREKLTDAINWLEPLFKSDCTQKEALDCWDTVYSTDFFSARCKKEEKKSENASSGTVLKSSTLLSSTNASPPPVSKEGGGRYA